MLPSTVHSLEFLGLRRQLLSNIRGIEYRLQVHPLTLTFTPFLEHITHQLEGVVPIDDPVLEGFLEG